MTYLVKPSKLKPLIHLLDIKKMSVYLFKCMLFIFLSTATLQQALANRCDCGIEYIATTSIDELNKKHPYKIIPKQDSSYFRLVNSAGQVLQDNLYDVQPYENNYIVAKRNGYYGVIDGQGNLTFNFAYEDIEVLKNNLFILTSFIGTKKSSALVSSQSQWIYPTDVTFKKGLEVSSLFVDKATNIIYFKVSDEGKYGIINHKGDIAVPLLYDYLEFPDKYGYFEGVIKLKQGIRTGLINNNFEFLVPMDENQIIEPFFYEDDLFKVLKHKPLKSLYIDNNYVEESNFISGYVVDLKGKKLIKTDTPFEFIDSDLYQYSQSGKFGLLNNRAEIVLNAQFDAIDSYSYTNVIVSQGNKHALASKQDNGEWLVHDYFESIKPIYLQNDDNTKNSADSSGIDLYVISNDKKFGVIDGAGQLLIPMQYDEIESLGSLLRVKLDNKYGLKTYDNEDFVEIKYDDIQAIKYTGNHDKTDAYLLSQNNLQTIIDDEGQVLIPRSNIRLIEDTPNFYMDGIIKIDGRYGVYDFENQEYILEPKYEALLSDIGYGLYLLQLNGKQVLVNEEGELINNDISMNTQFERDYDSDNIIVISDKNKYGMMNENGEIFIPVEYDNIRVEVLADDYFMFVGPIGETKEVFIAEKDGFLGMLNKQGDVVIPFEYTMINSLQVPALLAVSKSDDETDNSVGLINTKGELLLNYQYNRIISNLEKADGRIYGIESEKKIVDIYNSDLNLIDTQGLEEFKQVNNWFF